MSLSLEKRVVENIEKKVGSILTLTINAYKQCSDIFHEFYLNEFKNNIISTYLHNKLILKFDESSFTKFIDSCIMYRLGVSNKRPDKKDIMYDLSSSISPETYSVPLDEVLEKLIYSAVPSSLIHQLKSRISSSMDEIVVDLIISKLESSS
jgi:hypothetical protein